jgi:hypothetical protein
VVDCVRSRGSRQRLIRRPLSSDQEAKAASEFAAETPLFPRLSFGPEHPLGETKQPPFSAEKANIPRGGGAFSDAPLCRIVELWPTLSDAARHRIIEIVDADHSQNESGGQSARMPPRGDWHP